MMNIGLTEWLIIAVVALLLFGPSKLPKLGRSMGQFLHEFRQTTRGIVEEEKNDSSGR